MFLTNLTAFDWFLVVVSIAFLIYKYWTMKYNYWKARGVAHKEPHFPLGSAGDNFFKRKDHTGLHLQKIYNEFKGESLVGLYMVREPIMVVRDLEIIKCILTKDFNNFVDRGLFRKVKGNFLANHLFNMEGDEWKRMRSKLSPTFTSGKMKLMFNLIEVVAQQLEDYLKPLVEKSTVVDVKETIARFTTDIIATCAFGLEVNSLKNADSEFRKIGSLIFKPTTKFHLMGILFMVAPIIFKVFEVDLIDSKVSKFILKTLKDTIEYRKKNNVVRNDFIDLLTKVKEKTLVVDKEDEINGEEHQKQLKHTSDDELTLEDMAAQMFIFFFAGFETAASTTSFCLYELSKNKEIQNKVRAEIDSVLQKNGGKITYQTLQELQYMEKCISETLRRYASLPMLNRQCVKTYKVPGSDLVIEEGMKIFIPTYAIHHDPEYYPDPYKFDPERFSEDAIHSRHHYAYLPFGEGPRVCIGKRLGIMQVKMAVVTLLKDLEVSPAPGMPDQLPIDRYSFVTRSEIPVELMLSKRKI